MFMIKNATARAVLTAVALAVAGFGTMQVQAQENPKTVTVRPAQSAPQAELGFMVEAVKGAYAVNEPIRFRVSGTDRFFLYVYSVNDQGEATLILPSSRQPQNQYNKDRIHEVPNRGVEFAADRPGTERVVFVASRKYVDIAAASQGGFPRISESILQQQFESKGIVVRPSARPSSDVVVKSVDLRISGSAPVASPVSAAPAVPPADSALPFVSLDKLEYAVGDAMRIAFGSTAKGHVALYVVEPGGKAQLLTRRAVEANQAYTLNATTTDPAGDHQIVALFGTQAGDLEGTSPGVDLATKGVRLNDGKSLPTAVYRFYVKSK